VIALAVSIGRTSSAAQVALTERLLAASAAESAEAIRAHLEPAEAIVDLTAGLLADAEIETPTLETAFTETLQRTPQLSGAFVASPDGDFFFVSRDGDGFRHKLTMIDGDQRSTLIDLYDASGRRTDSFEDPLDTYDPTTRPWFTEAADVEGGAIWTDPYVFFTSQQLGITSARAIRGSGELRAVVGVDVELGELSEFLAQLDNGDDGGTVLVDDAGNVIAHPDSELLKTPDGDGFRPVSLPEFGDPYAQSAASLLLRQTTTLDEGIVDFTDESRGASKVAFESVILGETEWTLAVYAPSDSIVSELTDARERERGIIAVVGFLGIFLAAAAAYPATRTIDSLAETASTDELTGLPNRRSILSDAAALAEETGDRSIALIDIDYFKSVNSTHGHPVGDAVLRALSTRISEALPISASVGRIGGEEFLVLLPDHNAANAASVGERLRAAAESAPVQLAETAIDVTISVGIVAVTGASSRESLVRAADRALRDAKLSGRNAVVVRPAEGPSLSS